MAQTIKLKRSAVSGNTPSTSDLELGEIAINTYDGKVFIKKDDGSASVIEVGAADNTKLPLAGGTMTGALNMGGNNITSPSNFTLDVATNINLDAGTNGSIYLKDDGVTYGRLYRTGTADHFHIKSTVNNADIRLQGKNNLGTDITALTLDMSASGAAIFNDKITLGGNLVHAGDFTIDSGGDITLDADGADILLKDAGTEFGRFSRVTSDFVIKASASDQDLVFKGVDGGSTITALTLDMSNEGTAIFNHDIKLSDGGKAIFGTDQDLTIQHTGSNGFISNTTGDLRFDVAGNIKLDTDDGTILFVDGGTEVGRFLLDDNNHFKIKSIQSDADIIFQGNDGGSGITALTLDMSEGGSATFANNVTISGNLEVTGTTTQTGSIITNSNFTGLSDANSANTTDFGFYGKYVESSTTKYAGMYYDASVDNTFKLFCDTQTAPTTTVNESATGYALANLNIAGLTTTGNVGIGIANTTAPLVVQSQSNAVGINLVGRTSDSIGELNFASSNGTNQSSIQSRTTDLRIKTLQSIPLTFHTVNTERMRLDSSGNLLVGSTEANPAQNNTSDAISLHNAGLLRASTTNAAAPLDLNVKSRDGDIAQFRKDGTLIGTFGSNSGQFLIDSNSSNIVIQANSGSSSVITRGILRPLVDNTDDLGQSNRRFKDLHLSGVANVGAVVTTSSVRSFDGSATAASFNSINDINTGLFFPASNNLAVTTDGTERLRIDALGRVGIGTTAPSSTLEVAGTVRTDLIQTRSDGLMTVSYLNLNTDTGSSSGTNNVTLASANNMDFLIDTNNNSTDGAFVFGTNNSAMSSATELMRLTESGHLGIGTNSPSAVVEIKDTAAAAPGTALKVHSNQNSAASDGLVFIHSEEANAPFTALNVRQDGNGDILNLLDGTTEVFTVVNGGNVGIGTSSPTTAKLVVQGADSSDVLHVHGLTGTNTRGLKISLSGEGATNQVVNYDSLQANGIHVFKTAGTERMRIHDGGNVGIGTPAPAAKLHVVGPAARPTDLASVDTASTAQFQADASNAHSLYIAENASGALIQVNDGATNSTTAKPLAIQPFGGNVGIGTGTTAPSANLEVQDSSGSMIMVDDTNGRFIKIRSANSGSQNANISSYSGLYLGGSDNASHVVISNSGNVGIGESIPTEKLHVGGNIKMQATTAIVTYQNAANTWNVGLDAADPSFKFKDGTDERIRIDSSGNVGIGTASPDSTVDITTSSVHGLILNQDTGNSSASARLFFKSSQRINTILNLSGNLEFRTGANIGASSGTVRMSIIGSSGAVRFNDAFTFPTADGSTGQALITDGSGNISFGSVSAGAASSMVDADGDTKIQVEETSDDDTIRFDVAGTEKVTINSSNFSIESGGFRVDDPGGNYPFRVTQYGYMTSRGASITQLNATGDHANVPLSVLADVNSTRTASYVEIGDIGSAGNRFKIDNSGRVGIGTTSPGKTLTVSGTFQSTGEAFFSHFDNITNSSRMRDNLRLNFGTARTFAIVGNSTNMHIRNSSTDVMTFDTSNRVGIGTTSPAGLLHVSSGTSGDAKVIIEADTDNNAEGDNPRLEFRQDGTFVTASVSLEGSSGDTAVGTIENALLFDSKGNLSSQGIQFATGGRAAAQSGGETASTTRMTILGNGNIGIGTSAPNQGLHLAAKNLYMQSSSILMNQGASYFLNASNGAMKHAFHSGGYAFEGMNVGIGTTAPARNLHVHQGDSTLSYIQITNTTTGTAGSDGVSFGITSDEVAIWNNRENTDSTISTNNTERMRIKNDGKIGIGTTTPNYLLDVEGTGSLFRVHSTSGAAVLQLQVSDTTSINDINFGDTGATARGQIRYRHNGDSLAMSTAGVERLRINSSGQVGIGTAAPGSTLDVHGNTNLGSDNIGQQYTTTLSGFSVTANGSDYYGSYGSLILNSNQNYTSSSRPYMITNALGANKFAIISGTNATTDPTIGTGGAVTSGSVRLVIDNTGNVGIGTTSPDTKLDVDGLTNGGIAFTASQVEIDGSSTLPNGRIFYHGSRLIYDSPSNGHRFAIAGNQGTNIAMSISGSQNVGVGLGTTDPVSRFQVEVAGIDTTTTSTTATTQVAIDTFAAATFRSAEFTIQVKNSTDSTYHLTKVLLIHDGTTPAITEYGTIFTGSAAEATFDADISSGNVRLLATPASTDSMTFKVVRHCITV